MHAVQSAVRCASAHCVAARDRAIGVGIDIGDDDQVEVAIPVEVGEASGGVLGAIIGLASGAVVGALLPTHDTIYDASAH